MANSPNFSFLREADPEWIKNLSANEDKEKRKQVAAAFNNPKISKPDIDRNFKTLFKVSTEKLGDTIQQFQARSNSAITSCAKLETATEKLQGVPYLCLRWAHALLLQDSQDAWVHVDSDSSDEKTSKDLKLELIESILQLLARPEPEWELVSNPESVAADDGTCV